MYCTMILTDIKQAVYTSAQSDGKHLKFLSTPIKGASKCFMYLLNVLEIVLKHLEFNNH